MRANARGDLISGAGGDTPLWIWPIDESRPRLLGVAGGYGHWIDDDTAVARTDDAILAWSRADGFHASRQFELGGCDWFAAAAGNWLATVASNPWHTRGVVAGRRVSIDGWRIADMDEAGRYVLAAHDSDMLELHGADGHLIATIAGGAIFPRLAGGYLMAKRGAPVWLWRAGSGGMVPMQLAGGQQWPGPTITASDGRLWLCYEADGLGLVLHPVDDASRGYLLGFNRFSPILSTDGSRLTVTTAGNEGESIDSISRMSLQLGEGMVTLEPPARPVHVEPWPAPVSIGAWKLFYDPESGGGEFTTPAGLPYDHAVCEYAEGVRQANAAGVGVISGADLIGLAARQVAVLAYASDGAGAALAVAAARPVAEGRDLPLCVYIDRPELAGELPANLPPYAVLSWPWYTTPTEARDVLRDRVRAGVQACLAAGVRSIAPTLQAFDRSLVWPPHALADLQGDLLDLVRECADLVVSLECFAYGRVGGIKDHDDILAWHRASAAASPAGSRWPRPSQVAPPAPNSTPKPEPAPHPAPAPEETDMKARRVFLHTDDGRGVVIRPDNHLHLTTDRAHWTPLVIRMPDGKFDVGHFAEFERGDVENGSPIATLRTYPPYDAVEPNVILATPSCVMRLRISRGLEFGAGWAFGDVDANGPYYLSAAHEEDAPLMMRKNDDGTPQHQRNWFLTDTATGQEIDQPF